MKLPDDEIIKMANIGILCWEDMSTEQKRNRHLVLYGVKKGSFEWKQLGEEFKNDIEIVKIGLKNGSFAYDELNRKLKRNPEIIRAALQSDFTPVFEDGDIPKKLLKDKEFVLFLLSRCPDEYENIDSKLKRDHDIIEMAVVNSGYLFIDVIDLYPELKNDRILAKKALSQDPYIYSYLPDAYQIDPEFTEIAISKKHLVPPYNDDLTHIYDCLDNNYKEIRYVSERMQMNMDVVRYVSGKSKWFFSQMCDRARDDDEVVKYAVSMNGINLRYVSERLINSKEICLLAVKNNPKAIMYLGSQLCEDLDFVKLCLKTNKKCQEYINHDLLNKVISYNFIFNRIYRKKKKRS